MKKNDSIREALRELACYSAGSLRGDDHEEEPELALDCRNCAWLVV